MGTDPSGAGPEDEPHGSCLSNLFWLSHVFKTNPVWHSVYRTGTGDKSSFVTNTIPPSPNGKASTRDREREATWIHTRPVCFFSTFVVNIVADLPEGILVTDDDVPRWSFPNENIATGSTEKKNYPEYRLYIRYLKYYSSRVCFSRFLNSRGKFIPDSILKFHRLPRIYNNLMTNAWKTSGENPIYCWQRLESSRLVLSFACNEARARERGFISSRLKQ